MLLEPIEIIKVYQELFERVKIKCESKLYALFETHAK